MRRISLGAMVHFEAVARLSSFSAAAVELNLSQGAVSQQVKVLEIRLGRPLFVRERGALRLTSDGHRLLPAVRSALNLVGEACDEIQMNSNRRMVSIGALPTLAAYWLIPHAADFRTAHPDIELNIQSLPSDFVKSSYFPKLDAVGVDIAITYGQKEWPGLQSLYLFHESMHLACSPGYMSAHRLKNRADLSGVTLLQHTTRQNMWRQWCAVHQMEDVRCDDGPRFEHFFMLVQAARAGMGVALLPEFVVKKELEAGNLVRPSPHQIPTGLAYYAVWPQVSQDNFSIRRLVQWLSTLASPEFKPHQQGST